MYTPHLVLASASPRRRELLVRDGFAFEIVAADIDERIDLGESSVAATCRLAVEKAYAVRARAQEASVILAADTTVVLGGRIFGKPADEEEAVNMLAQLAGRSHMVATGWAIVPTHGAPSAGTVGYTKSWVGFRELTSREIRDYVACGESMDKAGAYAVQGAGKRLIAGIIGSVDNVIGLPAEQVAHALGRYGVYSEETTHDG